MNHYNCIYMYVNKVNNKKYIGQAKDFNRRHKKHITASFNKKTKHDYNVPFHAAIRKYGIEDFNVIILKENVKTQCLLNLFECYYIKKYDCLAKNGKGYNLASGGHNGNPWAGKTEEEFQIFKLKLSELNKGKQLSEEHKQKISIANTGKNNPFYGKHPTKETIQKLSGENNPMYGKHYIHSEETKQKISNANKGKYHSEETKRKLSDKAKGRKHSEETKQKIRISNSGENNARWSKGKRIKQEDKNGNLIKVWNASREAERETGIKQTNIIVCCKWYACDENKEEWFKTHKRRPQKSAGGFIWKYYTEDDE